MANLKVSNFQSNQELQDHYLGVVDRVAEEFRSRIITALPGQVITYGEKRKEALAYSQGAGGPFPWLNAEAEGRPLSEVADSILQAHQLWVERGAALEGARLRAKAGVREATTPAEMNAEVLALKKVLESLEDLG